MGKKKLGNRKAELLDPGQVLSGKQMWRAANAAARIELRPGLKAQHRAYKRYGRDMKRDLKGLNRLSNKTSEQVRNIYNFSDSQLGQAQQATAQNAAGMVGGIDQAGQAEQARLNELQGGVLGNQIKSLAAQQIQQGGSASQDALAAAAAQQQASTSGYDEAWDKFAAMSAAGMNDQASKIRSANQFSGAESKAAIRTALASRMADTRSQYGEAKRDAAGKVADLKALFGPTRLNNIMKLREGERSFVNERAALNQTAKQAALDRAFEASQNNLDRDLDRELDRDDGGDKDDLRLGNAEYRQFKSAADELAGKKGADAVTNWRKFLDNLGQQEGVNWSPVERKKFRKRYSQYG
jgi:hypothetical protein